MTKETDLDAITDFIDWLVARGYVIAKTDPWAVHLAKPISEEEGDRLAKQFLRMEREP